VRPPSIHLCMDGRYERLVALSTAREVRGREQGMAPQVRMPRSRWIEEGLRALAAGGPDAVRVDALAKSLGVTRGGFYWHFADRDALLEEMLDTWERASVDEVIARVEVEGGDATARLRRLSALADASDALLRTDLAVRDWSRRDQSVAERLRGVDNRRMEYLRLLFAAVCPDEDDVEARCLIAFSLWIANHFIAADHGARSRADVLESAMRRLGVP
jgi:AcrR family transcriptional regulator